MTETARAQTDAAVWNELREAMQACLRADKEICEAAADSDASAQACEAFNLAVDRALAAFSDLVTRGTVGLIEDVLLERGLAGDADDAEAGS